MAALTLQAPAKINLFLRVLGRREDGYHLIDTLLVPLDLHDTVSLTIAEDGIEVRCPGYPDLEGPHNLAHRACVAYRRVQGWPLGANILIQKRIPVEAGLGGGSSDAATTLLALQRLAQHPLPPERLRHLALELGADVPFFLMEGPCRARGIGEVLEPVYDLSPFWVILACASFGLSTREVYASLNYPLTFPGCNATQTSPDMVADWNQSTLFLRNDLQPAGVSAFPVIEKVCKELQRTGTQAVIMTGSGPTVFAAYESQELAMYAMENVRSIPGWNYLVARGMTARQRGTQ